ncbi:fungal-specific transcription factor domain-containing protein [Mycena capillaripes]|nr:fungal-specific transcription factor domain-containing protein [Mycena capillaripes]
MAPSETPAPKRRRLQGACDLFGKRKIRCDSSEMPGNKCSNCIFFKTQCTHLYMTKDSSSSLNYQSAREHVAAILSTTTAYVPSTDPVVLFQILVDVAKYARNLEELLAISSSASMNLLSTPSLAPEDNKSTDVEEKEEDDPTNDGVLVDSSITDPLRRLALRVPISGADENFRFFGKSSSMNFIKAAMQYAGEAYSFDAQRDEFWTIQPWQRHEPEILFPYSFPDDDLLQSLLDLYFQKINPLIFVLHGPSFRAAIADGEHIRDYQFGGVVLVVCALASRLSNDTRVLMTPDAPLDSSGWKWFKQARPLKLAIAPQIAHFRGLYKLQLICLSVLFIAGTSIPRPAWMLSGLGIRIAQEMGAHRRSRYNTGSQREGELLKRAFWLLIASDTILNSVFGRPTVCVSEDYDVDMPTECDDEYWDEPYYFQQPAGRPPLTAFITSYLKLMLIFNRVHRAIYPVKGQKECDPAVIAELDSALNTWVDSIPSHLRWDPNLEGIFLDQSATLYMTYYHLQILIHRPFIPSPGEAPTTNSAFPSLAICANSARSCGHVMEVQARRSGVVLQQPHVLTALFDAALILLLNVWGGRRAKLSSLDITRAMADIKKCVDVLHLYEDRFPVAGRKCDLLAEIINRGSGKISRSMHPALKRPIHGDAESDDAIDTTTEATVVEQLEKLERSIQQTDHLFSLPLYTQELGLLPVYESFDFQLDLNQHPQPESSNSGSGFILTPPLETYASATDQSGYVSAVDNPQFNIPAAIYSWQDWSGYTGLEPPY